MGTYDSFKDTPGQIKTEGEKIALTWKPSIPTEGSGTLSWNIPGPARGCATIEDGIAYCGIVIVARTGSEVDSTNIPVDGTQYLLPDPTVDPEIHSGDTIGNALVVGAFYEGDKKAKGEDLTTELVVTNVDPNTNYFFSAYATTCQSIYHRDGVRAYSGRTITPTNDDTPSYQVVELGSGVTETDSTNLDPDRTYTFDLFLSSTFPEPQGEQLINFEIPAGIGSPVRAINYGELVTEINHQVALSLSPMESPTAPNTGLYYCSPDGVFQWDGTQHVPVDNITYEPVDPVDPQVGDYWYNPDTDELKRWQTPLPIGWNDINDVTAFDQDPTSLESCDSYWFDGTTAYRWCAPTWCEESLITDTSDPSLPPELTCCPLWFDTENTALYEWNEDDEAWDETAAITWPEAPNALSEGTYWFDNTNNILNQLQAGAWFSVPNVRVECEEPLVPDDGEYWYNPDTEELKVWSIAASPIGWVDLDVLVWPNDPTDISSCDLWWNDTIYKWDTVNNTWNPVEQIFEQADDPRTPPTLERGTLWYNPDTTDLVVWDGQDWIPTNYITDGNDPTEPVIGAVWHDTSDDTWAVWGTPLAGKWNMINPFDNTIDPFAIPQGYLWQNTASGTLFQKVGIAWVAIPCSSQPLTPKPNDLWYDTANSTLMEWNGVAWVESDAAPVTTFLNSRGHLQFTTKATGSGALVMIVVPDTVCEAEAEKSGYGCNSIYSCITSHSFAFYEAHDCIGLPTTTVTSAAFIFNAISIAKIMPQYHGYDAVSALPSYAEINVGTDGTPDERRDLMNQIRIQLGYPSVEIELTNEQLDMGVRKALDKFRSISSTAYRPGYFFLDMVPGQQNYVMSNKNAGYDKIVTVMAARRFTSAFLSNAGGSGLYGQIVLQHLYNMGTYDLTSFFLVSNYIETMEHLFATRLTFNWHEASRTLSFYKAFYRKERVLLETAIEKTEQEILVDRWSKNWIERWALSEARTTLSEIRGKFSSLPGAGGGISLNASDLKASADAEQEKLLGEIDDFIANDPDSYGMGSTFIIG